MPISSRLSTGQRDFLRRVARAAFANPFSSARAEIDLVLGASSPTADPSDRISKMMREVSAQVERLAAAGRGDIRLHKGSDNRILRTSMLFDAYHRFIPDIDRHIDDQIRAGDKLVKAGFASALTRLLERAGFDPENIKHTIAVFFQIRRAYTFIARGLTGSSPCMLELKRRLWNNLFTCDMENYTSLLWRRMEDFSTLLLGETGTGKGAAAAALGRSGYIPFDAAKGVFAESFMRAFVAINLCQYPESLIESELFGHRKGAFTGAIDHHEGVLARCSPHGAIFLDEIGDVGIPAQVKLLQVLQERVFSPVGGYDRIHFHGRVIAATNRPLGEMRAHGEFRDDFYYRLCSDVIQVPTLRQRLAEDPGEMTALLNVLLTRLTGGDAPDLAEQIGNTLRHGPGAAYPWPGNVRELEQAARQVLLSGSYSPRISAPSNNDADALARAVERGELDAEQLLAGYCRFLHRRLGTYEEVAKRARLDRRTVKKHITQGPPLPEPGEAR